MRPTESEISARGASAPSLLSSSQNRELARIAAAGDEEPTLTSKLSRQGLNSTGIKSRIATAGTKYLAISLSPSVVWEVSFPLIMPSRHLRFGSKTPDPESPVVATSRMRVENFVRHV
jgi:hypothetical protein